MTLIKNTMRLIVCGLLCWLAIGCVSTRYVEHKQYLLNIKTFPEKKAIGGKCSVYLDRITALPPFDQTDFLYRVSTNQYLTDYYHGFLVAPTDQLEPILVNYLKALGNFKLDTVEPAIFANRLRAQIKELYADYRDRANPNAVIALRFILTKSDNDNKLIPLLDKTLYARVPLKEKTTNNLLLAWNQGWQEVLMQGVRLLNAILAKEDCGGKQ